jgi:phosphoenolpyruvate synthase/pyruvate phosphate dikinase
MASKEDLSSNKIIWLNEKAERLDEQLAGKTSLQQAIQETHPKGVKVGICVQDRSESSDFLEFLIREGIDSVSLNVDTFTKGTFSKGTFQVDE